MKTPPKEIVELGKEREVIMDLVEMGLVFEGTVRWERLKQIDRELSIRWNNLICD